MRKKASNKNSSQKIKKNRFETASFILKSFLIVFVLTCIILGTCIFVYVTSFKNGKLAINLDDYKNNQDQTSIIYATKQDGTEVELARLHGLENRIWVKYEDIPQNLKDAFVALEDKRFEKHHGVDWKRIISAATIHHFSQGGSTMTQQLIKNLTNENAPTFSRKFNEICYALNLEKHYSKKDILEAYLNTIPLGSGCYGVQTAAKTYFGKDVGDLNLAECAVLSCITKAPTRYNPLLNPSNNKKRQETCLRMMHEQGKITKSEYEEAKNYKLIFTNNSNYVPSDNSYINSNAKKNSKIQSYYVDYIIDTLIHDFMNEDGEYGYDKAKATRMVYYGGLRIHSCINLDVQKSMEDVFENRDALPQVLNNIVVNKSNGTKEKGQAAMAIMDYKGRIVGVVGGVGKKTQNRIFNRAVDSYRQPGSSIKPLSCYTPAVENNLINWSTKIQNYGILKNGKRWPQNYGGKMGAEDEYVTVQHALSQSLNTVPVRIIKKLGCRRCLEFLSNKFHFSKLILSGKNTDANYSSLGVGGMSKGVSPLEMCAAYATFGNGGYYYKPHCYTSVTNSNGKKIYFERSSNGERVLQPNTADVMNELLRTVITVGTGRAYGVRGFTTYAKTGTTTNNKDKWIVGGTPYYVGAVWCGYDEGQPLKIYRGSNPSGKIFKAVMNNIHKNLPKKSFKKSGVTVQKKYCQETGLLAGPNCINTGVGWYKSSKLPDTCDDSCVVEEENPEVPNPENPTQSTGNIPVVTPSTEPSPTVTPSTEPSPTVTSSTVTPPSVTP